MCFLLCLHNNWWMGIWGVKESVVTTASMVTGRKVWKCSSFTFCSFAAVSFWIPASKDWFSIFHIDVSLVCHDVWDVKPHFHSLLLILVVLTCSCFVYMRMNTQTGSRAKKRLNHKILWFCSFGGSWNYFNKICPSVKS